MAGRIEGRARELIEAPNVAYIATVRKDGSPHSLPVWVDLDDDGVVTVNGSRGRVWVSNVERDGRISITVPDKGNPYEYVTVRGRATVTEDGALEHIDRLAQKYIGQDRYPWLQPGEVRVRVTVEPEGVLHYGG